MYASAIPRHISFFICFGPIRRFLGMQCENSSDAEYIDEYYSSEYDDFSSSSVDSSDSTSSSSGQKTSSSAEPSSSLTSSSSEEYDSSKTSAYIDSIYDSRSSKTYKTVQISLIYT